MPDMPDTPRSAMSRTGIIVLVIVVLAIAVGAGLYGYRVSTARRAAVEELDKATKLLQSADLVVLEVDDLIRQKLSDEVGAQAGELLEALPDASAELDLALKTLAGAAPDLPGDRISEAEALADSARARQDMLLSARPILEANEKVAAALSPALAAWDLVLEAEKIADQSVAEYNKLTKDSATAAQTLGTQAGQKLTEARTQFAASDKALPGAKLSRFTNYVDEKLKLLELSKKAISSFLAGDNATANEFSNQFNAKDKQISALAKTLPESPSGPIADAYEAMAGVSTDKYNAARDEATKADAELARVTE